MLRRNLLKSLTALPFLSVFKLQESKLIPEEKLYRTVTTKSTYDQNGKELTYEDSSGYWRKCTYDQDGKMLTCEDSTL